MRVARNQIAESRKLDDNETISEALIDLYLSVKIRSNEEVRTFLMIHGWFKIPRVAN